LAKIVLNLGYESVVKLVVRPQDAVPVPAFFLSSIVKGYKKAVLLLIVFWLGKVPVPTL
jgi:hypothetical protein